jgi:hypothetical protein
VSASPDDSPRSVPILGWLSRGLLIIEVQEPAEPRAVLDSAHSPRSATRSVDQPVAKPLVVPLKVVVIGVLPHDSAKVTLPERDDLRETFRSDGPDKPLCVPYWLPDASAYAASRYSWCNPPRIEISVTA